VPFNGSPPPVGSSQPSAVPTAEGGVRRCWYCLNTKPVSQFTTVEHPMLAALGGNWTTTDVCDACQVRANNVADRLVTNDFLTVFLRAAYKIGNRAHKVPPAPWFDVPLRAAGGVVQVSVKSEGATLTGKMSAETAALMGLSGVAEEDRDRLEQLVGRDVRERLADPRELARARRAEKTPPEAWSRFMAKLGLACGGKAYGEDWLNSRHAQLLSADLLADGPPRLSQQREHHPPLGEAWPYVPPNHNLWIADFEDVAMLHVVLFGQLLGMVPINAAGTNTEFSGWRFDPMERTVSHSSHEAMWGGTAAARVTQTGRNVMTVFGTDGQPYMFVEDGPEGPMDLPGPTYRAESSADALRVIAELGGLPGSPFANRREAETGAAGPVAPSVPPGRAARVGRNDPCPCGSGVKYKRCCG
jgi:SEC-C motif